MTGLELDRAVEAMASGCRTCRSLYIHIGNAHQDLNAAARAASRRPNERTIAATKTAKAGLAFARENAREHLAQHLEKVFL